MHNVMKLKMIDFTQFYGLTYDSFVNLCRSANWQENSFDYMWKKLRAFDVETADEIKLFVMIEELLDSNYEINLIYRKSESESKKPENVKLKYHASMINIGYKLQEPRLGNFDLEEFKKKIASFFVGANPEFIYRMLLNVGSEGCNDSFRELIDISNLSDGEDKMSRTDAFFDSNPFCDFDSNESISKLFSDPVKTAACSGSGKQRTLFETEQQEFISLLQYVYADWLIHEYEPAYKLLQEPWNFNLEDLLSFPYTHNDLCLIMTHDKVKNVVDVFFEYVLSKNIDEKAKTYILEFFSNKRVSRDVQDRYEKYCETHPDAVKIEFLPDKFLPIPLPKLEQWTESCLRCLYQKLIEGKFIAADTKEIDFLYVFGYCNEDCYDEVEPIIWIGDYKNKLGKKQIIDLLVLMGYDFVALKKKPLLDSLNGCFCATKSKQPGQETLFKSNNFSRGHESNMHKELECIVREALSGV